MHYILNWSAPHLKFLSLTILQEIFRDCVLPVTLILVMSYGIYKVIHSISMIVLPSNKYNVFKKLLIRFMLARTILIAKLRKAEVVYLTDYDNNLYITVASKTETENLFAYTYFDTSIGPLLLVPDGTIQSVSGTVEYIKNWLPYDQYNRIEMILRYGIEPFNIIK